MNSTAICTIRVWRSPSAAQEMQRASSIRSDAEAHPATERLSSEIDVQVHRLGMQLDKSQANPYRPVFAHLKTQLENAKKGETPVPHTQEEPMQVTVRGTGVGHRSPDFLVSALTQEQPTQFKAKHGPADLGVLLQSGDGDRPAVLRYAKKVSERAGSPVTLLAMAVTNDADVVRKQHVDMKLTFPIHDGNGMRLTFGVEHTRTSW